MKYLLLIGLLLGVLWFFRAMGRENPASRGKPSAKLPERMVECARCGVYLPESESFREGAIHYCCAEHRAAQDKTN